MEGAQGGRSRFENLIGPIPAVPGLKFHPTNEEVINFYLPSKIAGNLVGIDPIRTDQDIISRHPGTLQAHYPLLPLENAWWFYTTRDSKYPNNSKPKIERAGGYWKVSKASDPIGDIGFKRVLTFREGFLKPSSTPTDWFMEEYSIKQFAPNKEDENWIIARIYQPLRRSQLISAGSLSPDLEEILLNLDWNSGGWSGSGYPFEPLGSGGTGMEGGRSRYENLIRHIPAVLGLKFHPTNEEVINPYLQNKNARYLVEIDPIRTDQEIISHHPGTFQANYPLLPPENAWWFYTTRDSKYPNNSKPKIERAGGYWKVSKASNPIGDIGFKRVLHFREGSLKSSSMPTDWYMEEYSIKQFAPNKEDENWIIARIYQQLTMPLTNIVPMTIPLSTMPIHTTFPLTMSMPTPFRPREILQPTYFVPSQSPRSPLISAGSLSPDPEIQAWPNSHVNSGECSGSAYYLPLDSGEGVISGSPYPFQPPGSGGTGTSTSAFPSPWCTPASGLSTSGS